MTASVVRAAAVQMGASLGDVNANLERAEYWVRRALGEGARFVVLPEFFASGMAFDPARLLAAHRPLDGPPAALLRQLAQEGQAYVAGSFLASSGADVFNTFVLALPDGTLLTHDKDFPSAEAESACYAAGDDRAFVRELGDLCAVQEPGIIPPRAGNVSSGVLQAGDLSVGATVCWEQVRYRTARRLRGEVDLVLAASAWPLIDSDVGVPGVEAQTLRARAEEAVQMVRAMPQRFARLVGAPVVHANLVGEAWSPGHPARPRLMHLRFMGESQIVDVRGETLARRSGDEGEGLVVADINAGSVKPVEPIPAGTFWTPEMTKPWQDVWYRGGAAGRAYYLSSTRRQRRLPSIPAGASGRVLEAES